MLTVVQSKVKFVRLKAIRRDPLALKRMHKICAHESRLLKRRQRHVATRIRDFFELSFIKSAFACFLRGK